jgi:glutamyl-tRNA reductase
MEPLANPTPDAARDPGARSAVLLVDIATHRPPGRVLQALKQRLPRHPEAPEHDALTLLSSALATVLPEGWRVFSGVHGGSPSIDAAVSRIVREAITDLVVVPVDPHYDAGTTGTITRELYRVLRRRGPHLNVAVRSTWHEDGAYVNALARRIAEHASRHGFRPEKATLRFEVRRASVGGEGEQAARRHIGLTVTRVADRLGWPADRRSLESERQPLSHTPAQEGTERVLTCRLPFPTDPAEAMGDVDDVCPAMHTFPPFISALKSVALHGAKPPLPGRRTATPLLAPRPEKSHHVGEPARLVMIGASLEGSLGGGRGPRIHHSTPSAFGQVRTSRKQLRSFLEWVRTGSPVYEAFVWNTCQRVEFYGYVPESLAGPTADLLTERIRRELFGSLPKGLAVNVLGNVEVRHHLTRTACGLNSDLPGDRDVAAQLETSGRIARCAGTAGQRVARLIEDAGEVTRRVQETTSWGRFATGYCEAALARVSEVNHDTLDEAHHVVIGGSATSRSILTQLCRRHEVPQRQLILIYRDHHGQMSQLRAAVGCGRRLRVHSYSERRVLRAIADADFVFFGMDQPHPVLTTSEIHGLRDFTERPLTMVDFNSSGSVSGAPPEGVHLWTPEALDQAVAAHTAITATRKGFTDAVAQAEEYIADALGVKTMATGAIREPGSAAGDPGASC